MPKFITLSSQNYDDNLAYLRHDLFFVRLGIYANEEKILEEARRLADIHSLYVVKIDADFDE